MNNKEKLRSEFLQCRKNIRQKEIKLHSKQIRKNLFKMKVLKEKTNILSYYSYKNEVRTKTLNQELIAKDKNIYLPYCLPENKIMKFAAVNDIDNDIVKGAYGIPEPKVTLRKEYSPKILDLILVPGVAFSRNGYRLGYGGGYYDRFLSQFNNPPITIGLTFSKLLTNRVPVEEHDLPVDYVVTEKEIIAVNPT